MKKTVIRLLIKRGILPKPQWSNDGSLEEIFKTFRLMHGWVEHYHPDKKELERKLSSVMFRMTLLIISIRENMDKACHAHAEEIKKLLDDIQKDIFKPSEMGPGVIAYVDEQFCRITFADLDFAAWRRTQPTL